MCRFLYKKTPGRFELTVYVTRRHQSIVADLDEAFWKDMEQESSDEFFNGHTYPSFCTGVLVVPGKEGDLAMGQFNQAVVGDGDSVRVKPKVCEDLLWSSKGLFRVHYPFLAVEVFHQAFESKRIVKVTDASLKAELIFGKSRVEQVKKLALEFLGQGSHGDEKTVSCRDPFGLALIEDLADRAGCDMTIRILSGKEIGSCGPSLFPVFSQQGEQPRAEHDRAIFAPFSGSNMDKHALRIDIAGCTQRAYFRDPQPRSVCGGNNGSMFSRLNLFENPDDLLLSEDLGESFVGFWPRDIVNLTRRLERSPVKELDARHMHSQLGGRDLALLFEMEEKCSNLFLFQ